jgi:hypothetical protein
VRLTSGGAAAGSAAIEPSEATRAVSSWSAAARRLPPEVAIPGYGFPEVSRAEELWI